MEDISLQTFFQISLRFISTSEKASKTIGYMKVGDFPVVNSYDIQFVFFSFLILKSEGCFSTATTLVPLKDLLNRNLWYFGYFYCCSDTQTTIQLSIYKPEIFIPSVLDDKMIDSTFDNIFGIDFKNDFRISGTFISQFSFENVTLNSTFYVKFDDTPTDTSFDFSFKVEQPLFYFENVTNPYTNLTELLPIMRTKSDSFFRVHLLVESFSTKFRLVTPYDKTKFQIISNNRNLLFNSTSKRMYFRVRSRYLNDCPIEKSYKMQNIQSQFFCNFFILIFSTKEIKN
jgi:hypothetical protein